MKLFNLQNKLVQLEHMISKEEMELQHMSKEQFEALVKMELYKQVADYAMKLFNIEASELNEDHVIFRGRGYMMNEKDMLNVLLEVCQLDNIGRDKLEQSCKFALGIT